MSLADILAADAAHVFCNPADFGETLSYRQARPGPGQPPTVVSIQAMVWRYPLGPSPTGHGGASSHIVMLIPRGSGGVNAINRGADQVLVDYPKGTVPTWHLVEQIIQEDAGAFKVLVR